MGNQNSGRRPQPSALKVLRGNPGQRKLNKNEPCPPSGEVVVPEGLSSRAKVIWEELAPICLAMGTLTVADVRPFGTLCELQAAMLQASAAKDMEGFAAVTLRPEDRDKPESRLIVVVDAVFKLERDTAGTLRPYYEYFGLTPASRARISVPKRPDEPVSKWAGLK